LYRYGKLAVVSLFIKKVSPKTGIEMFFSERTGIPSDPSQEALAICWKGSGIMKLLLVDDEELSLAYLKQVVAQWGYDVVTASNGLQAWEYLQDEQEPVLAVVDWVMPVIDGVELCRRIKSHTRRCMIYVIMLTVRCDKEGIVLALNSGADDYISKPFHAEELQSRIHVGRRMLEYQYTLEKLTEELICANQELNRMVTIDGLTGIANRRHFEERYRGEWRRALREEIPLAVIMVDIDYFKKYNDFYGHMTGDECLKRIAAVLAETVSRAGDLVARYGGEEFVVLLPNTDNVGAIVVAEALRSAVNRLEVPHCGSPTQLLSISLGVATVYPQRENEPEELLEKADRALYRAKAAGRNNVRA